MGLRSCADRRRADQRGTVALMATLLLAVLMASSAFAVDLGMQRVAKADVQALADVVALDLARNIDGRTAAQLKPVLDAALAKSVARNDEVFGDDVPDVTYQLGTMVDGAFTATTGTPSSVLVEAHTDVGFAFAGVTGTDSGAADQTAAAQSSSTACFKLGTFVAAVRSGDSTVLGPLNDMLGVNLDLVSYKALAGADLRLSQLTAISTIGTPEHLLSGNIYYADLVRAMIEALTRENSTANVVAIQALNKIAASAVTSSVGLITLGDVLHVAPTDKAALEVALSVLDIIGTARLSDGDYFLGVPNIQAQVPGVGFQFSGALYLVSAAELACGAPNDPNATADNAQLNGKIAIDFTNMPSFNIPGLGSLQTPKGTGAITVVAGEGEGALVSPPSVRCGSGTLADPSSFGVKVSTGLASYQLTADVTVGGEVKLLDLLGLSGLTSVVTNLLGNILTLSSKLAVEVSLGLTIGTQRPADATTYPVSMPPNDTTPVSTGGSMTLDINSVVPHITSVKIGGKAVSMASLGSVKALTDLIIQAVVVDAGGLVKKSLAPLVDNINEQFIGPVARMVGLRLAGADIYGVNAKCGIPRLVG